MLIIHEQLKFAFYLIFHPFKGFDDMKYEGKGRVTSALIIVLLLAVVTIVKQQFSGFVVNYNNLKEFRTINQLAYIIFPFFLWCIANWSTTTLMDGEGTFSEIIMATGYALIPMVLLYLLQTLYSNVITQEESAFYYFFDGFAIVWFVWLLFVGTMTMHQYTASKTILTMLLTLLVIGIILFIGMLFFSLIQQIIGFIYTIYKELTFRI